LLALHFEVAITDFYDGLGGRVKPQPPGRRARQDSNLRSSA
jgi:hypothetical protein